MKKIVRMLQIPLVRMGVFSATLMGVLWLGVFGLSAVNADSVEVEVEVEVEAGNGDGAEIAALSDSKPEQQAHIAHGRSIQTAVFAGGCFWCMEPPYDKLDGVISTISGYSGGRAKNANYKKVSAGVTKHYEVIQVTYDASIVNYETLLAVFWRNVDPLDPKGQFCDKGTQYLSAVFYQNEAERLAAEQSRLNAEQQLGRKFGKVRIVTDLLPAEAFYPAEKYHQDYYQKNPLRYKYYRTGCGRDKRLKALWSS